MRWASVVALLGSASALAQTAAQAPTSPQQPGRQLAETPPPAPGAPAVNLPVYRPAFVATDLKVRPSGFKVSGVTLFTEEQIRAQVAEFVDKQLDFNGLADIAAKLKRFYVDAGYPLTDVYFPEQSFAAEGGTIEFAVIEARLGKVSVNVAPGALVRADFVNALVEWHLESGQPVTQAGLDRAVLLLRDLPGITAGANVSPGSAIGLADVVINVSPQGSRASASSSFDNFGAEDFGNYRFTLNGSFDNLLGYGDTVSVSVQPTDKSGTHLYRLGYRSSIGPGGTKVTASISQTKYEIGGAFTSLNASGDSRISSFALIHPLVRGRAGSNFLLLGADAKSLVDSASGVPVKRVVRVGKLGLLGNHAGPGLNLGASTSYSLMANLGQLDIRDQSARQQDGLNTGPRTQGSFHKFNIELQRLEYLSETVTLQASLAGQATSRNLAAAEKLSLTGPTAVRAYGLEAGSVVDRGMVVSLEVKHRLPYTPFGATLKVGAFYDRGEGSPDARRDAETNSGDVGKANRVAVDGWGIGASLGTEGKFFINTAVAWRLGGPAPSGNANSKSRFWLSVAHTF